MFKSVHQSHHQGDVGVGACLVENVESFDHPYHNPNANPKRSSSSIGQLCQTVVHIPHNENNNSRFLTSKFTYYTLVLILIFGITMLIIVPLGSTFLFIDYQQQLAYRKSNKSDFCKSKCLFGAECILDDYTNQAFCRCSLSCPDDYQPVCGSDGITYINKCHLKYESCNKQQIINVTSNGTCDALLCKNVTCQHYQKCQVDEHGLAQCVCPSSCNHNGSVKKEKVCGSNKKLYNSECELYKHSCFYKIDIVPVDVKFCTRRTMKNGDIDDDNGDNDDDEDENHSPNMGIVCGDQICHRYAKCQHQTMSSGPRTSSTITTTTKTCQCLNNCSNNEYSPICATNNQNYANECEMKQDACLRHLELKVLHRGQCGQCDPPCQFYSKCQLNRNNIPECVCPQVCLRVDQPVCGDNGVTYENECELRVASCRIKKQINVQFNSSCDLCHNIVCHYGATCFNGECLCTDNCQNNLVEPLCANDGNTYRNECEMNRMACNSKKELIALFYGRCEETNENYFEEFSSLIQTDTDKDNRKAIGFIENTIDSNCNQSQMVKVCQDWEKHKHLNSEYVYLCDNKIFKNKCEMMKYGCHDPNRQTSCSKYCNCHKDGIQMNTGGNTISICDAKQNQCLCKEEFQGANCDQCSSKFWNPNPMINNSIDCKPCNCNKMGSISEECEDTKGKCKCKPGVKGHKCDRCPPNMYLTYQGCVSNSSISIKKNDLCSHKRCKFGAICREDGNQAICVCQFNCNKVTDQHKHMHVCASDGSYHKSMCHFRQYVCDLQKRLQIVKHCPSI